MPVWAPPVAAEVCENVIDDACRVLFQNRADCLLERGQVLRPILDRPATLRCPESGTQARLLGPFDARWGFRGIVQITVPAADGLDYVELADTDLSKRPD